MSSAPNPGNEPESTFAVAPAKRPVPAERVPVALLWAVAVGVGGALAGGYAADRYGLMIGTLIPWPLGFIGGWVSRKITVGPCKAAAWLLVAACIAALLYTLLYWLKVSTTMSDGTWQTAFDLIPQLFQSAQLNLIFGAVFAGFGAYSAYWQAGRRFRRVYVIEE